MDNLRHLYVVKSSQFPVIVISTDKTTTNGGWLTKDTERSFFCCCCCDHKSEILYVYVKLFGVCVVCFVSYKSTETHVRRHSMMFKWQFGLKIENPFVLFSIYFCRSFYCLEKYVSIFQCKIQ